MVELGDPAYAHYSTLAEKSWTGEISGGHRANECRWRRFRYYTLAHLLSRRRIRQLESVNKKYTQKKLLAEHCASSKASPMHHRRITTGKHGTRPETDFIYVHHANAERTGTVCQASDEVGPKRSLLICCGAFPSSQNFDNFPNLTLKKDPLGRLCQVRMGQGIDYSLEIKLLPKPGPDPERMNFDQGYR